MARFATLTSLKKYLNDLGYKDLKDKDARSVFVLTNGNRTAVFNALVTQLGGKANPNRSFGGSLGHIDVENYRIGVKPLSKQGSASAGVENEANLVQAINYMVQQYGTIDVIFTDGNRKFMCKEVQTARQVGADTAGRKKADVMVCGTKEYPVSLKKDNAEYWESADSFWRDNAEKYLTRAVKKGDVKVESLSGGVIKITPNIGVEATDVESVDVIFGSDILGKGCVVTRTFEGNDFRFDGKTNTLTINTSSVITKLSDVPDSKKVWFLIRNDSTRKSIPGYPGTRALAAYKSRITGNVLKISRGAR